MRFGVRIQGATTILSVMNVLGPARPDVHRSNAVPLNRLNDEDKRNTSRTGYNPCKASPRSHSGSPTRHPLGEELPC